MFILSVKLWPTQFCIFFFMFPFKLPDLKLPVSTIFSHDIQLLWYFKQWQDGDSALAKHPACVATSQLLLRDITADNLLWIFITLTHTDTHTHPFDQKELIILPVCCTALLKCRVGCSSHGLVYCPASRLLGHKDLFSRNPLDCLKDKGASAYDLSPVHHLIMPRWEILVWSTSISSSAVRCSLKMSHSSR